MYGLGMAKGLAVTLKNLVLPSRFFTLHQYPTRRIGPLGLAKRSGTNVFSYAFRNPKQVARSLVGLAVIEDRNPQHPRFRGEEFTWYVERCTGCASCAKYCPLGIIRIVTEPSGCFVQEGQKYGVKEFDIDIGRCMFCGLCVEACPYDALHMGSGFEEGQYSRSDLVIDLNRLRQAPKRPSTFFKPHLEGRGYDPIPSGAKELGWHQAGRHQRPSLRDQEEKWAKR